MAGDIGVFISGDRELEQKFDAFPQAVHGRLLDAIAQKTNELEARIEALVPRRTGKLASEIVSSVTDTPDSITGKVSVAGDFLVAGALEYGVHKDESVRAHQMRLTHLWARAVGTPLLATVPQTDRHMNLAARRFMRAPLEVMRQDIEAALRGAVSDAVQS